MEKIKRPLSLIRTASVMVGIFKLPLGKEDNVKSTGVLIDNIAFVADDSESRPR